MLKASSKLSSANDCFIMFLISSSDIASNICFSRCLVDSHKLSGTNISADDFQYIRKLMTFVSRIIRSSGSLLSYKLYKVLRTSATELVVFLRSELPLSFRTIRRYLITKDPKRKWIQLREIIVFVADMDSIQI